MKLKRGGEHRGNRNTLAGEVLRSAEQPRKEPWDPRDPEMLAEWLRSTPADDPSGIFAPVGYAMFDLEMIRPGLIQSEDREREVQVLLARMAAELQTWKARLGDDHVTMSLTQHMLPAVLLDPHVKLKAPKPFMDELHLQSKTAENWFRDSIRMCALLFPGKLDPLQDQLLQKLKRWLLDGRAGQTDERGHNIAASLATARLVAPERYAEMGMIGQDREEILKQLAECRHEEVELWKNLTMYPQELFLAMIALADEVSFSKVRGLQIQFNKPVSGSTPVLPERSAV